MRGPRGGYELARERRRISVAEISQVAESSDSEGKGKKPAVVAHVIAPALAKAERAFEAALSEITIDALCREAEREGMGETKASADFNI